jgi:two-component system, OmpR family, phosphate regulon response regulator OmpR
MRPRSSACSAEQPPAGTHDAASVRRPASPAGRPGPARIAPPGRHPEPFRLPVRHGGNRDFRAPAYNGPNVQNLTPQMPQAANILVVDDDQRLRELLDRYLGEQGFGVRSAANAEAMDSVMSNDSIDMIILDLMLPGEDGLSICRRLRATGRRLPIIMLTAKGDEADRITGLEIGADDYLPKPFNPRELVARINAVLRRQSPAATLPGAPDDSKQPVRFGPFELNIANRTLVRKGVNIGLTTGEFAMLKALVTHPRIPLSRDRLMELARGREYGVFDRSIDVQVSRLRKLIEDDPAKPRYLQTVWGVGYVFVPDEK